MPGAHKRHKNPDWGDKLSMGLITVYVISVIFLVTYWLYNI